ncbi:YcjF family protein [Hyphomonas sp. WL0036]|uniref:YcjF family protein n=1 Tax=Hyphomonas sediminis TaxID=2866160 RepID=UPI001C81C793|nr:YcjF family protein [Hyphomonas sediminis]MBY9066856.1 YcjF family protein [Hyphomonas sediminis]
MANAPVPASAPVEKPAQQWELAAQWAQGWRVLKVAATVLVVIAFLMVIGQGYLFYRLFDDLHPMAGLVYIVALTAALAWLVGRPVAAFLSMPVAARPPDIVIDARAPDPKAIAARLRYDVRYLQMLAANPEVQAERAAIEAGIAKGRELAARAARATPEEALALSIDLQTFERVHVEALLAPLDKRVNQLIHAEAVGVGVATALSMNGTVDAFIVLWRNANLVAKISRIYFGRPHLMGSLRILRDVAAIVVAARALEDVTDITGDVIGSLLGRMGGLIAGPVMDGGINAMMTLKLGYLAKRRCRSFKGWTAVQASAISEEALEDVKQESGSVISDLLKRTGGLTAHASRATEKVLAGSRSAWELIRSWFGGNRPQGA